MKPEKIKPIRIEIHYRPRFDSDKVHFLKIRVDPADITDLLSAIKAIPESVDLWDLDTGKQHLKAGKEIR